ncbi:PAS domain S-box protein [Halorutilales archaeon Cl-col2-1]
MGEFIVAVVSFTGIIGVQRLSDEKDIYRPLVTGISLFFLGFFVDALEDIYEPGVHFEILEATGLSVGIVLIVFGIYRWMSKKEKYEKSLKETNQGLKEEKKYREKIEDSFEDIIYIHDTEGDLIDWNARVNEVTGYSDEEIGSRNVTEFFPEEDKESIRDAVREAVETGGIKVESLLRTKDGKEIPYEFLSSRITNPEGETVVIGIGRDISERKKRERRLSEYKQAIESSKDLIAAVDRDFNYLFANDSYIKYNLPNSEEIVGKNLSSILGEEMFEEIKPHIQEVLDGEAVEYEMERESPEGEDRVFDIRYYPLRDDEGEIRGIAGALRDITEHKRQQERLRDLVEVLKVVREVNECLVRYDSREEIATSTAEIISESELFGCTFVCLTDGEELTHIGKGDTVLSEEEIEEFHSDEYVREVFEDGILVMEDVTSSPYQQHSMDKGKHEGVGIAIHHGGERYGILTVHSLPQSSISNEEINLLNDLADDIGLTLNSIQQRELREEREQEYRSLYNSISDPVFVHEMEGELVSVNRASVDKLGYSEEELLELELQDITLSSKEEFAELNRELEEDGEATFEGIFLTKTGYEFQAEVHASVTEYRGEKRILSIARDITDLKQREKQLRVFDRILRHNMHNKMNVILGYSELLEDKLSGEEREQILQIHKEAESLVKTTDKEAEIVELISESRDTETVSLDSVVQYVIDDLSEEYPDAEISYDTRDGDRQGTEVSAIPEIRRAITELVENAVIHNDMDTPQVTLSVEPNEMVEVCISDNGPTIPEMERGVLTHEGRIEPLYHGSLGLWLVNWIVRESGGELGFERNDPRGNIVKMKLPRPEEDTNDRR